ncbi:MAG: dephospho-CoA kinase [Paludibacteraceae bacterium]|nr:dephospho-CoA kinase [Paludibacteraceae bacterium]
MLKIGITGGIGSGKSVLATLLKTMGYPVYNSDIEAKKLCNSSPQLKEKLQQAFGKSLYQNDELNKVAFSTIIFSNPDKLKLANSIIHPFVTTHFLQWAQKQQTSLVFIESAILFESELINHIDQSILIIADEATRIQRVMERDKAPTEQVLARIKNQLPETERLQKADYIIYNDNKQAIIPQLQKILAFLQ